MKMTKMFEDRKFLKQFISYFFVGFSAAIVEWSSFFVFNELLLLNIFLSTALSFVCATTVNWVLGRKTTFKEHAKTKKGTQDVFQVFFVSGIGLGMNLLLMWLFVDILSFYSLLAKIIATGIVFIWNFASRKYLIYK